MSSSHSPSKDQMNSPVSETLDGHSPLVRSLPNLDGASVQSPVQAYSPLMLTSEDFYPGIFDYEAPRENLDGLCSPFRAVNDDSTWTTELASSSNVSDIASELLSQDQAPDLCWLFTPNNYETSTSFPQNNDETSTSTIVPSGVGAGLKNLGNTCFLNAIMQCFTHTVPLVKGLRSCTHSAPCDGHTGGFCVICAFRDHINRSLASSGRVLSPWNLVNNLSHFCSMFRRQQQEDAHEFMQCALDKLERCFLDLKKKNINFEDDNLVEKVFGGRLLSKLRCGNCSRFSDTYEPLIDLSLEIENVDTLSSALESFTKVENVDAQFRCDGCKEKVSMEKQLRLHQTPIIAAFHLKRFKTDGIAVQKIDKHVVFPLELDLQPYTISNENNNVPLKYDLYAVVVHNGFSSTSGHYFCFVRSASEIWHKLDDSMVTKVSGDCVLSQEAYLMFYARQGTPWFSSIMDSPNISRKSVLDMANTEQGKAAESKEFFEQQVDYYCQETSEFLEMNDIFDVPIGCEQLPDGSNQESVNLHGSEDILVQVQPENNAILNGIAMVKGNSCRENVALDENKTCHEAVDDGFHPLTPTSSPSDAEKSFHISRDHLKKENGGSCKKPSNKFAGDSARQEAAKYASKMMPDPRRDALLGLMGLPDEASSDKNRRNTDSSQCKAGNPSSSKKSRQ